MINITNGVYWLSADNTKQTFSMTQKHDPKDYTPIADHWTCMHDLVKEGEPMCIACPCPKCSVRC